MHQWTGVTCKKNDKPSLFYPYMYISV